MHTSGMALAALAVLLMSGCGSTGTPPYEQYRHFTPGTVPAPQPVTAAYPAPLPPFGGQAGGSQFASYISTARNLAAIDQLAAHQDNPADDPAYTANPLRAVRTDRHGNFYLLTDQFVLSLAPDYSERWRWTGSASDVLVGADDVARLIAVDGIHARDAAGLKLWFSAFPPAQTPLDDFFGDVQWRLGADGTLVALGLNGRQVTAFDRAGGRSWTYTDSEYLAKSGCIDQQGNIYTFAYRYASGSFPDNIPLTDTWLLSLDRAGALRFRHRLSGQLASGIMAASDGTLVFGTADGVLHRVNSSGSELWRSAADTGFPLALLPTGGIVYSAGKFYLGVNVPEFAHPLAALDRDGTALWQTPQAYWAITAVQVDELGNVVASVPDLHHAYDERQQDGARLQIALDGTVTAQPPPAG